MIQVLIPGRARVSVFSKMPSPALGPKHFPIQWVLGIFSWGVKWPVCEVRYSLTCPIVKSENEFALLLLLYTFMVWTGASLPFLPYHMKWLAYLLSDPRHMPVGHVCPMAQSPSQRSRDRMRLWYEDSIRWHCSSSCDSSARLGYLSFSRRRSWNRGC